MSYRRKKSLFAYFREKGAVAADEKLMDKYVNATKDFVMLS